MSIHDTFVRVRQASRQLALLDDHQRNRVLEDVAEAIALHTPDLLEANAADLQRMGTDSPLYDRLKLTGQRLEGIASDMRHVATLPSPLGRVQRHRVLPNGLELRRVSVPFGVIGVVYEARPNVTFDVFALCFKSGNACVLKGGSDAEASNRAAERLIHEVLRRHGVSTDAVALLPPTHEATAQMLEAVGYIDLCIPRGGRRLIQFVRQTAKVPVIETGAGVVHCFLDAEADDSIAADIIVNAKCRRPSVCNTLDCLLVHPSKLPLLLEVEEKAQGQVALYADAEAYAYLRGHWHGELHLVDDQTPNPHGEGNIWNTEWMSLRMGVKTVHSLDEALEHIATYGSGHSECIITENAQAQRTFQAQVDAACVYVNAPTSFTDGAQFGLGAEIGISTQKLGARGPMGLEEITTYKWLVNGHGQVRER